MLSSEISRSNLHSQPSEDLSDVLVIIANTEKKRNKIDAMILIYQQHINNISHFSPTPLHHELRLCPKRVTKGINM